MTGDAGVSRLDRIERGVGHHVAVRDRVDLGTGIVRHEYLGNDSERGDRSGNGGR